MMCSRFAMYPACSCCPSCAAGHTSMGAERLLDTAILAVSVFILILQVGFVFF